MWVQTPFVKVNVSAGQPVLASAGGTVSDAGRDGDFPNPPHGNYVYIDHGNGWVTNYLHLMDAPTVTRGQVVARGQQIGRVGNSGTEQPHLHYSQWRDGDAVRIQFNGIDINTWTGNLSPWGNGERLTSANCGRNLIVRHSQMCLTAPDIVTDGGLATQATCNGSLTQMWSFYDLGVGRQRIQSVRNGKCLDVHQGLETVGKPLVLNSCNGSATQIWLGARQPAGQDTWWDYRLPTSGLCMVVPGANRNSGVGMALGTCQGFSSQIFRHAIANGP